MLVALAPAVSLAMALEMVLDVESETVLDVKPEFVFELKVASVLGLEEELIEADETWLEAVVTSALRAADEPETAATQHLLMLEKVE